MLDQSLDPKYSQMSSSLFEGETQTETYNELQGHLYEIATAIRAHPTNPNSFDYPADRLLKCFGTVSDREMYRPNPSTIDQDGDPVIMVVKNGIASKLTIGRLNSRNIPSKMSKEISVLPRDSKSGPFSARGDCGSVVIDGSGRICGILTGGDGANDLSDHSFVTSINFILKRLAAFGIEANIFPSPNDLSPL